MKVVILSDNKPGHYNQSLGIAQNLPDCEMVWQDIHFRNKWRDNLLRLFMYLFGGIQFTPPIIKLLLKWSVNPTVYISLMQVMDVDVVLSTGSSVASVNLLLGNLLNAKTVTSRIPSPVGIRHFDLAILPMLSWHHAKNRKNVCKTIGVPNTISPEKLNIKRDQLNLQYGKCIGLLIGGTDKHETITLEDAKHLFSICESVVSELNIQILLTTSRRTPSTVTDYLKSSFKSANWCQLFIEPDSPSEIDEPYQTILSLSDILIVSADSFSMVCEAASSGRSVIALSFSQIGNRIPRRYQVYKYLQQESVLHLCEFPDLKEKIHQNLKSTKDYLTLSDTEKAVNAILEMNR